MKFYVDENVLERASELEFDSMIKTFLEADVSVSARSYLEQVDAFLDGCESKHKGAGNACLLTMTHYDVAIESAWFESNPRRLPLVDYINLLYEWGQFVFAHRTERKQFCQNPPQIDSIVRKAKMIRP